LSTLGGELGGVEYDFFDVVSRAAERGFTPEEIERAYKAASAQAFNKPGKGGRPPGRRQKGKNVEGHLKRMREILISRPGMPVFTAAKEVIKNVPAKERPTPQHLMRTFIGDEAGTIVVDLSRALKALPPLLPQADASTADFERLCAELMWILERRYTAGSIGNFLSSPIFQRFCAGLRTLNQQLEETSVNKKS
jgi:hypothetical protein